MDVNTDGGWGRRVPGGHACWRVFAPRASQVCVSGVRGLRARGSRCTRVSRTPHACFLELRTRVRGVGWVPARVRPSCQTLSVAKQQRQQWQGAHVCAKCNTCTYMSFTCVARNVRVGAAWATWGAHVTSGGVHVRSRVPPEHSCHTFCTRMFVCRWRVIVFWGRGGWVIGEARAHACPGSGIGLRGGSHAVTRETSQPEIPCFARVFRVSLVSFGVTVAGGRSGPGSRVSGIHPRPLGGSRAITRAPRLR